MRNIFITIILFYFYPHCLFAQLDSLTIAYQTTQDDSMKSMTALKLSFHYIFRDIDSSSFYLNKGWEIANEKNIPYAIVTAYNIKGIYFDVQGKSDSAYYYFIQGIKKNKDYKFADMDVRLLNNLGLFCWNNGKLIEAQSHFFESLEKNKKVPEGKQKVSNEVMLANIGLIYQQQDLFEKALEFHLQALSIRKNDKIYHEIPSSLNNIGICYRHLDSLDKSAEAYLEGIALAQEHQNLRILYDLKINLALVYTMLNKHQEALQLNLEALNGWKKIGQHNRKIMSIYAEIAGNYIHLNNLNEAKTYIEIAFKMLEDEPELEHYAFSVYGFASTFYYLTGQPEKGLKYKLLNQKIQENLYADKYAQQLSEMETKYELALKDEEIELLNLQKHSDELTIQKQRLIILSVSLSVVIFIVIAYTLINYNRKQQKRKSEQELQAQKEAERIRIACDMHDEIGAGLTRIVMRSEQVKIQLQSGKELKNGIVESLDKMAAESRELSHNIGEIIWALNPKNDTLDSLFAYIRNYVYDYLDEANITCKIEFPENIPTTSVSPELRRNVFLIVKESLNNLVKHSKATRANVTLLLSENHFSLTIQDNGTGITDMTQTSGNGLGNMKKRTEAIDGDFIVESNNGLCLSIENIPFKNQTKV